MKSSKMNQNAKEFRPKPKEVQHENNKPEIAKVTRKGGQQIQLGFNYADDEDESYEQSVLQDQRRRAAGGNQRKENLVVENRDQYLSANMNYLLNKNNAYTFQYYDPDESIEWEDVEAVSLSSFNSQVLV